MKLYKIDVFRNWSNMTNFSFKSILSYQKNDIAQWAKYFNWEVMTTKDIGQNVKSCALSFLCHPHLCTPFSWHVWCSLGRYIANNLKTFLIFDDSPEISYQSKLCNFPKILIELNCEGLGKLQMIIFKSTRL